MSLYWKHFSLAEACSQPTVSTPCRIVLVVAQLWLGRFFHRIQCFLPPVCVRGFGTRQVTSELRLETGSPDSQARCRNAAQTGMEIGVFKLQLRYRAGSRVVPIPFNNYRTCRKARPCCAIAHNWSAHGGRLTAGCPAFLAITTPLPFRDERLIRHSPKCRAACAIG